jgi:hypothetical protein
MKEIKKGKERIESTDNLLLFSLWELLPCSSILLSRYGLDHNMINCGCKKIYIYEYIILVLCMIYLR